MLATVRIGEYSYAHQVTKVGPGGSARLEDFALEWTSPRRCIVSDRSATDIQLGEVRVENDTYGEYVYHARLYGREKASVFSELDLAVAWVEYEG